MDEDERWAAIPGFSRYEASSLGNIRRVADKYQMKPYKQAGRLSISLTVAPSEQLGRLVHRLIAFAFLPNPENYPEVDHIDRNPLNNRLSNLRWANKDIQTKNRSFPKTTSSARPIVQTNTSTGIVSEWRCAKDAGDKLKLSVSKIRYSCRRGSSYMACIWKYKLQPLLDGEVFLPAYFDLKRERPMDGVSVSNRGRVREKNGRITLGCVDPAGYSYYGHRGQTVAVHQLVAYSHLEHIAGCTDINHKDMNKVNNEKSNLEWATRRDNTIHGLIARGRAREVEKYSLNGELLDTYGCVSLAASGNGIDRKFLKNRINTICNGYLFKYKGSGDPIGVILTKLRAMRERKRKQMRRVIQYDLQMKEIMTFDNFVAASKKTGINHNTVFGHLKYKRGSPCKKLFYFKYEEDEQ